MAKTLFTECPYCHRKVSIIGANVLKTKGEHVCKGCKCISNVVIRTALYAIASISVVTSLVILLLYTAMGDHSDIKGVLYVLAPFIVFYLAVPFFVKLEPCTDKSAVSKLKRKISPIPTPEKTEPVRQDKPIDLDVGEDFRQSFAMAKSMSRTMEENFVAESGGDISSGSQSDIDISAESEEDVKVYSKNTSESVTDDTVIFKPEKTPAEDEDNGQEVSFLIGGRK